MNATELFLNIKQYGEANSNAAMVEKYSRYFREGYDAFGLNHEQVKGKVNEILSNPSVDLDTIYKASDLLVKSPKYEMTAIAIQLLLGFKKSWNIDTFKVVEHWFSIGINNWAHTDYISGELMNLFFSKNLCNLDTIASWKGSDNRFQRRAAVVSLIKPMKVSQDMAKWFEFIEPMMHDPAREVHQGLGWFLREAWKKQSGVTEEFLLKYKESAPRLIFQYATEKMTPEQKMRFRKTKPGKG